MSNSYEDYWNRNTFALAEKVKRVRSLLNLKVANEVTYARFGSDGDGGYVLVDDITPGTSLISYGVDVNVDFEKHLSDLGCSVVMYDDSVDGPPIEIDAIFHKKRIGIKEEEVGIDSTLADNCILKLDIEGSEWDTLAEAKDLSKCRQITIEAHWLLDLVYDAFYEKVVEALENLNKTHFPVWIHANNDQPLAVIGGQPVPNVFEILFLNRESYSYSEIKDPFAGLNSPNNPLFPDISLTFP
jgi:hypothetical protein